MVDGVLLDLARRSRRLGRLAQKGRLDHPALARARSWAYAAGKDRAGYADPRAGVEEGGVDAATMTARFVITTTAVDRDGDVVESKGCRLDNYAGNPVVLFGHQSTALPIGTARAADGTLAVTAGKSAVHATCHFHGKTAESNQVFALVKEGVLRATSIGFLPLKASRLDKEAESEGSLTPRGWHFQEWDLLEWSIVGVPSNPEALAASLSKGRLAGDPISDDLRQALEPFVAKGSVWVPGWKAEGDVDDDEEEEDEDEEDEEDEEEAAYDEEPDEEDEDEDEEDDEEEEKDEDEEPGEEEERQAPAPYGARLLGAALAWMRGCKQALEAGLPRMERPFAVTDLVESFAADLADTVSDLEHAARRYYPDLDFTACLPEDADRPALQKLLRPRIAGRERQPQDEAREVLSLLQAAGRRQDQIDQRLYQLTGRRP